MIIKNIYTFVRLEQIMKSSPRRCPLKKENSTDNYYKDSLKPRPISFSPKKTTTSQSRIPIPLPKIPKSKQESFKNQPETTEQLESEIETKLRLKLKSEYTQRYHLLQNKYNDEIIKSSIPLDNSFLDNLAILFQAQNDNQIANNDYVNQYQIEEEEEDINEYEYEYEYTNDTENSYLNNESLKKSTDSEIGKIEKEIENQKRKQNYLQSEIEKNTQVLNSLKSKISDSIYCQNSLQNEQQEISNQIEEAYIRNSNLFLELSCMKEQKQFEIQFNELPETFDGTQNLVEYPDQIIQECRVDTAQVLLKAPPTKKNRESTSSQNQTYFNSFENSTQPLINLSCSTDSEEDPMLLYLNQSSNNVSSSNNIENDSLDEDSLEEEDIIDDGNKNALDTKTEYTCHVEDYIMTDEEVLTYTTKYEEQKQFTLETMIETQEESTIITESFELKPPGTNFEEEEDIDDLFISGNGMENDENNQELTSNNEIDKNEDILNSNELPKELFRSPYRIKIPIRPPKK